MRRCSFPGSAGNPYPEVSSNQCHLVRSCPKHGRDAFTAGARGTLTRLEAECSRPPIPRRLFAALGLIRTHPVALFGADPSRVEPILWFSRLGICYAFCGPAAAMLNGVVKQWSPAGAGCSKMSAQEARDAR